MLLIEVGWILTEVGQNFMWNSANLWRGQEEQIVLGVLTGATCERDSYKLQ